MNTLKLKSNAKINLALDVLGKREDGYHFVDMIMQSINLSDYITLEDIKEGIIITSNNIDMPLDENNIAYKAAHILKKKFCIDKGISIDIQKNIPMAAGLAGGSSNAAAVIVGLNKLWNLNLNIKQMQEIGVNLGADVPFCITGGTYRAQGIGEDLTRLDILDNIMILISKPDVLVSTAYVYNNLDMSKVHKRPNIKYLIDCISKSDINSISVNMANVLESVTENEFEEIKEIKKEMLDNGALGAMMSGSGPTVFGIFDNAQKVEKARDNLAKKYKQTYFVKTCKGGIDFEG